ncbi:Golgi apparatus membrane protein tvp18 [Phlyctochytrium planicorne]|nr:Golgi apparatus membrane protein tvp18 [Phlyctochytrium planicorne]
MTDINELLDFIESPQGALGFGEVFGDYASDSPVIGNAQFDFANLLGGSSKDDGSMLSLFGNDTALFDTTPPVTPPMESPLAAFGSPNSATAQLNSMMSSNQTLKLTPAEAANLLSVAEQNISLMFPHLVPAVERLRASLRASGGAATPVAAPPTPASVLASPLANNVLSSMTVPWEASPSLSPLMDAPLMDPSLPHPKPKAKVGRKRKVRSMDPVELMAELDQKRQRNTEAARRSRLRKMAEMEAMQNSLSELSQTKGAMEDRMKSMEDELSSVRAMLEKANAKLQAAGLAPFSLYGQWMAILSGLLLIIFGLASFSTVVPFAFAAWVEAFLIILLEIPIVTQCCACGPATSGFLKFFENAVFRTVLYVVFAGIIWLSILMTATSLIIGAISLTVTVIFYGIAASKKEELTRSFYTGGKGLAPPAAQGAAGKAQSAGNKFLGKLGMAKTAKAGAGTI